MRTDPSLVLMCRGFTSLVEMFWKERKIFISSLRRRRSVFRQLKISRVLPVFIIAVRFPYSDFSTSTPQIPPFDHQPRPYNGPFADEVFLKRKKFLGPSLFHFYQTPLNIVEGKMQYLFDKSGRRYLDAFAGIVTNKTITPLEHCQWLNKLLSEIWLNFMNKKLSLRFASMVEKRLRQRRSRLIRGKLQGMMGEGEMLITE